MNATRRTAFDLMMERYARAKRASRAIARQALIDEGIYTPEGEIAPAYGSQTSPQDIASTAKG